jgi:enoyl-CoA hydratase/carnithine racemase
MSYGTLLTKKRGSICYIALHRPSVLNAFNEEMGQELISVFGKMQEDSRVAAVILTGSGEKAFSAGADLKDPRTHSSESIFDFLETKHGLLFDVIANFQKPVIAAVNGYAIGIGLQLALCCDIVIASENAVFSLPQVSLGVMPAYGGAVRLARFVGKGRAMEIILTCKRVDAQEAYRIGLVNQVVPLKELMPTAKALGEKLAEMPPLSLRLAKEALNKGLDIPLAHASNTDLYRNFALEGTEDRKEGHRVFGEKRRPRFKGR